MSNANLGRKLRSGAVVAAVLGSVGMMGAAPADAGGVSPGAAVGIGLGAFALGTMTGAAPYYGSPYYAPGYYAPPAYYPPPPAYVPRSCWNPYYQQYYAC